MSLGVLSQFLVFSWSFYCRVRLGSCLILHKYGGVSFQERVLLSTSTVFPANIRCCLQVILVSSYICVCLNGFWLDMGFFGIVIVSTGLFPCSLVSSKWYRDLVVSCTHWWIFCGLFTCGHTWLQLIIWGCTRTWIPCGWPIRGSPLLSRWF